MYARNVRRLGWIGVGAAWIGAVQACGDPSEDDGGTATGTGGTVSGSGGAGGTRSSGGAVAHAGGAEGSGGAGNGGAGGLSPAAGGDAGRDDADVPVPGRVRLVLTKESGRPVTIQSRLPCGLMPGWFSVRVGDAPFDIIGSCGPIDASCPPLEYSQLQAGAGVSYDWTVPQVLPQDWGDYRCSGAAPPDGTTVTVRFCWGPSDWSPPLEDDTPDEAPAGTDCVDRTFPYGGDQTIEYVIEPLAEAGNDASEGGREAGGD